MDIAAVSASSASMSPAAGTTRSAPVPNSGNSATLQLEQESTQVTFSLNATIQFSTPSSSMNLASEIQNPDALVGATIAFNNYSESIAGSSSTAQTQSQIQISPTAGSGTNTGGINIAQSSVVQDSTETEKIERSGVITLANGQTIDFTEEFDVSGAVAQSDTISDLTLTPATPTVTATPPSVSTTSDGSTNSAGATQPASQPVEWPALLSQYNHLLDLFSSVQKAVDSMHHAHHAGSKPSDNGKPAQIGN